MATKVQDQIGTNAKALFALFLAEFKKIITTGDGNTYEDVVYLTQAATIKKDELTTLFVDFADVKAYDDNLCDVIKSFYYRYKLKATLLHLNGYLFVFLVSTLFSVRA